MMYYILEHLIKKKPTSDEYSIQVGFTYFCTYKQTEDGTTNVIMIYHKEGNILVDATDVTV